MAGEKKAEKKKTKTQHYSRRDFLVSGGAVLAADTFAACSPVTAAAATATAQVSPPKPSYAASKGYLVYDSKKCAGCVTCMLSCSLVHEGKENLSLARIQIAQESFGRFPRDIKMAVCRQCITPVCVQNCPTGAAFVDSANGNVRRIDQNKCIGCKTCIWSCPQQPNRTVWNPSIKKSSKCDLCVDTPHWNEKGGPAGKQACVETCPMRAIKFVAETPDQTETDGYDVNLRNEHWLNLGLVESMDTVPSAVRKHAASSKNFHAGRIEEKKMTGGYAGKILRVNLTKKSINTIDTGQYEEFGGGHGFGSAIFWDLVGNQLPFSAFDPRNVVTVMAGPFSGVVVPAAAGRCEVQGLGPYPYPIEWFTRSNFGGRFSSQLKYAGWDGIVIEGASDDPVWISIVNDKVTIESAKTLWGLDILETQEEIWRRVVPGSRFGEWLAMGANYTTQKPAVLCIGPAGEAKARIASLVHDAGNGAGQGGFGAVWGSKKLKAVSVLGTGDVPIANPMALMDARLWYRQFQYNVDNPRLEKTANAFVFSPLNNSPADDQFLNKFPPFEPARPQACAGCPKACRQRMAGGISNESSCADTQWPMGLKGTRKDKELANDLVQYCGINVFEWRTMLGYLRSLYKQGMLGPGKQIDCDLPMNDFNTLEFIQTLVRKISQREGIGDVLSNGCARAAETWGRYKEDTDSGVLNLPNWGYSDHYEPRIEVEWSYGSILGDRDINEHSFNFPFHHMPEMLAGAKIDPVLPADKAVAMISSKVAPYAGDPLMFDYGEGPTGIYSDHRVKTIAWHRHYTRFWIQSVLFCDWVWPLFFTPNTEDKSGPTPEGEPRFFNAVTGKSISFADGVEIGRKIWNMDRAIWALQGRHRDMEVHAGYVYKVPTKGRYLLPAYENGQWSYADNPKRVLNKAKFEEWKTKFYDFEGWNTASGWPKRSTLEKMGLKKIADTLQSKGKLG